MTRTPGPPSTTKSELEMLQHFGQGGHAAGRYNFVDKIGNAGAGTTSVVGRGLPMAARA